MKTKTPMQFRQGDVLIERVDELPAAPDGGAPKQGRVILAHGEVTGHAHEIAHPERVTLAEMRAAVAALGDLPVAGDLAGDLSLRVRKATQVVHQEHTAIPLKRGTYVVRRQREYAPEAIRQVAD